MQSKILTRSATLTVNADEDELLSSANDVAVVEVADMHSVTLFVNHVVDDPAQTNGTRSSLALVGPGTNIDTVVEAVDKGTAGDSIGITFADGSLVDDGELSVVGLEVTFAFKTGVTTVLDFETAVAALTGDDAIIQVKTIGTPGNVLVTTIDEFVSQNLAGGADGEGGFDLKIETTIDGVNFAVQDTLDETDYPDGSNVAKEIVLSDANGMPKRVKQVRVTLTTLDDTSKFSVTAVGVSG